MHNLTKIKLFRILLYCTYPFALVFIFPFVLLKKKSKSGLFFFFDRYAIGGAQRIHIDILNAIADYPKNIFFTRKSLNDSLKKEFYSIPNSITKDIHFWCDNLLFRLFTVHFYSFSINRQNNSIVFSSNSTFFYDLLPWLRKSVKKIELLHNFTFGKKGMEFFGLANHQYLDTRIVYDAYTFDNIHRQYKEYKVHELFFKRIEFIEPGVEISDSYPQKDFNQPLQVLYAGRGGPQKRIHLINKIAEYFITNKMPVQFHFAGTMIDELSSTVKNNSVIYGPISDWGEMNKLYQKAHVILMTSAYEGFPMLIKEGMAMGCVPVVTALEGNKMHLFHESNALLIREIDNEKEIVKEGIYLLIKLIEQKELLNKLSHEAFTYASAHFTKSEFIRRYRSLLRIDNQLS